MPVGYYRGFDEREYWMNGAPTASLVENFPHPAINTDLAGALVSGVMTSVAMPMMPGDLISTMSVISGATALVTPSNAWMALYSPAGVLLGQSVSVPTQAVPANGVLTHTFSAPIPIPAEGIYFAAIMIAAVTVPTLVGKPAGANAAGQAAINTAFGFPALAQSSGSGLLATAPPTITGATPLVVCPYVVLR